MPNICHIYNRLHITVNQQKHTHTIRSGILTPTKVLNYQGYLTICETIEFRDSIPGITDLPFCSCPGCGCSPDTHSSWFLTLCLNLVDDQFILTNLSYVKRLKWNVICMTCTIWLHISVKRLKSWPRFCPQEHNMHYIPWIGQVLRCIH